MGVQARLAAPSIGSPDYTSGASCMTVKRSPVTIAIRWAYSVTLPPYPPWWDLFKGAPVAVRGEDGNLAAVYMPALRTLDNRCHPTLSGVAYPLLDNL